MPPIEVPINLNIWWINVLPLQTFSQNPVPGAEFNSTSVLSPISLIDLDRAQLVLLYWKGSEDDKQEVLLLWQFLYSHSEDDEVAQKSIPRVTGVHPAGLICGLHIPCCRSRELFWVFTILLGVNATDESPTGSVTSSCLSVSGYAGCFWKKTRAVIKLTFSRTTCPFILGSSQKNKRPLKTKLSANACTRWCAQASVRRRECSSLQDFCAPVDTLTWFSAEELRSPGFFRRRPKETLHVSNFSIYHEEEEESGNPLWKEHVRTDYFAEWICYFDRTGRQNLFLEKI